jgi:predicted short-subunit dehydrogenase-like oxidoreductase (DUF2520 family)
VRVVAWVPPPSPPEALSSCRTVLLVIRDGAIVPFIEAWPALRAKRLVHLSGSPVTPMAEGAHPIMTFDDSLYELDAYRAIPFILDAGGTPFEELLPGLPNPSIVISAAERLFYHALCVMAGNFSTVPWLKLFEDFQQRLRIPPSAARAYLAQVTANLMRDSHRAVTGPLSRRDAPTIAANQQALEGDPFHAIYSAFVRAYEDRL